jgi:hypothetical protein
MTDSRWFSRADSGIDLSREHEMAERLDKLSDLNIPSGYLP